MKLNTQKLRLRRGPHFYGIGVLSVPPMPLLLPLFFLLLLLSSRSLISSFPSVSAAYTGSVVWTKILGQAAAGNIIIKEVALDHEENLIVAGSNNGAAYGPGATRVGSAGIDIWVAKLDKNDGSIIWARQFGDTSNHDESYDGNPLYVNNDLTDKAAVGNIYVHVQTKGINYNGVSIGAPQADCTTLVYNNGTVGWTTCRTFSASGLTNSAVCRGPDNHPIISSVVAGSFEGLTQIGSDDGAISMIDKHSGALLWKRQYGSTGMEDWLHNCMYIPSENTLITHYIPVGDPISNGVSPIVGDAYKGTGACGVVSRWLLSPAVAGTDYAPTSAPEINTLICGTAASTIDTAVQFDYDEVNGRVWLVGSVGSSLDGVSYPGGPSTGLLSSLTPAFVRETASTSLLGTSANDQLSTVRSRKDGTIVFGGTTTGAFPGFSNAGSHDVFFGATAWDENTKSFSQTWFHQFGTAAQDAWTNVVIDSHGFIFTTHRTVGACADLFGETAPNSGVACTYVIKWSNPASYESSLACNPPGKMCANGGVCDTATGKCRCGNGWGGATCTEQVSHLRLEGDGSNIVFGDSLDLTPTLYSSETERKLHLVHVDELDLSHAHLSVNTLAVAKREAPQAMNLLNSWVAHATFTDEGPPAFLKDSLGRVWLQGTMASGTSTDGTVVANLPAGYRPSKPVRLHLVGNSAACVYIIRPTGALTVHTDCGNVWVTFDGANFMATQ